MTGTYLIADKIIEISTTYSYFHIDRSVNMRQNR